MGYWFACDSHRVLDTTSSWLSPHTLGGFEVVEKHGASEMVPKVHVAYDPPLPLLAPLPPRFLCGFIAVF